MRQQQNNPERQRCLREFNSPTVGYRRAEDGVIESMIFDGEIPDGWVDSPANVGDMPPPVSTAPEPVPDDAGDMPAAPASTYEDLKINELRAEYKRRTGAGPGLDVGKRMLIETLIKLDHHEA